jgi:hypothetical protein
MKSQRLRAKLYPTIMSGLVLRIYLGGDELASASRDGIHVRALAVLMQPEDSVWYQVLMARLVDVSRVLASSDGLWSDLERVVASLPDWAQVERVTFGSRNVDDGTEIEILPQSAAQGFIVKTKGVEA